MTGPHRSADVCVYTYDTFLVDPCPIVRVCVYLSMSVYNFFSTCLEVSTKLYHNTVQANHQTSSPAKSKWRLGPLLFSCHPIPSAIAKYTPYEPYTTYFDRPNQSVFTTALIRLRRLKISQSRIFNFSQNRDILY